MRDWRPQAGPARSHRARLLAEVRGFFARREVLEVETPILGAGAPLDPALESWRAEAGDGVCGYLQTSPEYPMKRLLAAGEGDIYQIARVFRGGESGPRHNPEFSLLEWYRRGFDHHRLATEVIELIRALCGLRPDWHCPDPLVRRVAYGALFRDELGIDPLDISPAELARVAGGRGLSIAGDLDRDGWLDALVSLVLAPRFPPERLTMIFDYPESQAVLARPCTDRPGYAARFEVYWGDLELANGYHELTDAAIFRARRERDRAIRQSRGQEQPLADPWLESAMAAGLPDCAGVALGLDRLLMRLLGVDDIRQVLDFPAAYA
ncbi:MAG: EF-P lysine aminoacylase EpmA [Pseudomonadota bacterium]